MTRVAFLVTHLSGSGHFVRTRALARAVAAAGGEPLVLSGGLPLPHLGPPGVEVVQLPPLRVEGFDYATPRHADGRPATGADLAARAALVADRIAAFAPHALVTETWPLGRRRLAQEYRAAVAAARAARPGARILASVRDVPEPPGRPGRLEEAAALIRGELDALLVHGEAAFLPLSASWPLPADLAPRIHHTGYVADPAPALPDGPRGAEVLVSVGGGVLGRPLLALAAAAAARGARPWRLLVGGPDAAAEAARLMAAHPGAPLLAGPARPDYGALLARAACSVSLAGYNTAMDLAACATPAILVPEEAAGEREQRIRAERLARAPGFTLLPLAGLTPDRLAASAEAAATGPARPPLPLARDGAVRAAALILRLAREVP